MISKIWAWFYLWFNYYCPRHVVEKEFTNKGWDCQTCVAERQTRFLANVEHAGKILRGSL